MLAATLAGCTPLAVGAVVAGGATTIASVHATARHCDGEGCAYTQVLGALGLLVGLAAVVAGGVYLATE